MNDVFGSPRGWLSRSLSLVGVAAISWAFISQFLHGDLAVWAFACSVGSMLAWLLLIVLRVSGLAASMVLIAAMVGAGGISAGATAGVTVVPAAVAVLWLTRDIRRPVWWGAVLGVITIGVLAAASILVRIPPLELLAMCAAVLVAFLGGESRRQFLLAGIRSHELIEEQARADVLAARQELAHDIHDVLAHSLGALVIQLDAVDALLDSGDTTAAATKVRDARSLAKDGLSEARRAVAALSDPDSRSPDRVSGNAVASDVSALVMAHESLGGIARLVETGTRADVSGPLALALRRAVQEGLTNARKHAPGAPVAVRLEWQPTGVIVEISNPLAKAARAAGGGHGLVGMRERFSALPGGTVTSGVADGRFVVTARATTTQAAIA
jgi:signal transduction histidine kinase